MAAADQRDDDASGQVRPVRYRHTQVGWFTAPFGLFAIALVTGFLLAAWGSLVWTLVVAVIGVPFVYLGLVLFSLTTIVRGGEFEIHFFLGLHRRRFVLDGVLSVDVRRKSWWEVREGICVGLNRSVYYGVGGRYVVALVYEWDRSIAVGTSDPEGLTQALRDAMGAMPSAVGKRACVEKPCQG